MPNMIKIPKKIPAKRKEGRVLVIGAIGRFVKAKGFAELIRAGKILNERVLDFKILIAGSGEGDESLRSLVKELGLEKRVEFLGWVKNISGGFFDKIDIFCLSSHFEPFGIVLLQAMLHKKAIVSTNAEGPNDIFEDGKDAVIVSKDDLSRLAESLAGGLERVLKDKVLRGKIARNGHRKVLREYGMRRVSGVMGEVVKKLKIED